MKLPEATLHVGWVTTLNVGVTNVVGCAFITAGADAGEVHAPEEAVTV